MKNSIKLYRQVLCAVSVLMLTVACSNIHAQQAIGCAGGDGTGIGSFSFTYGQVLYTTAESISDDASFMQGVQIPFESFVVGSCATDFNFDGITNGDDFAIFLGNFGLPCSGCPTDLTNDGFTNGDDFAIFLGNFGLFCN